MGQKGEPGDVDKKILAEAVKFHGHLGPFLVLGLKAGLYATKILGRDPMKMKAIIKTHTHPPHSCFADGVQFSTGCTLGKRNITLEEENGLTVTFIKGESRITLELKDAVLRELENVPFGDLENTAIEILKRKMNELFEIKKLQ
ncbi:formylmethanofuran dehydrogenase [Candidatus Bathyarchaeota archaeon]|nr:MAG: formylmethanofuran dehydrogenase [Candidatus Bathyarchaeota archaeon]